MPPTTIHAAPALDSFTPLSEHQEQTPTSFYNAKPVLHYHANVRAIVSGDQVSNLPIFPEAPAEVSEGDEADRIVSRAVESVLVFVSSENLTLFNSTTSIGVSIPYPSISLHAIQRLNDPVDSSEVQGLYMQLELSDPHSASEDDEMDPVELTLIHPPTIDATSTTPTIKALFEAVSNCSNLHPDPAFEGEDEDEDVDDRIVFEGSVGYEGISGLPGVVQGASDGGLPPPFPGSGGWITAENVNEYFDEEGNWIGEGAEEGGLGEGAGRVRTRDEADGEEGANGDGEHGADGNKWARTD